ncbi:nucleotidyltransferase domain-containing protein [Facklamia sp. P13064]|uniref:nucleotidyltransferase domain-containing protein n=1 Tax=Facklamia sp. P13064 TaxID=3421953 RepID=UPI003D1721D8
MKKIIIQNDLKEIIKDIDVSDANYVKAEQRYKSISNFIESSNMSVFNLDIYLQGSFKLGTAVKPLTEDGSYDIDIVCNFTKLRRTNQSQFSLKYDMGEVVKDYVKSKNMSDLAKESKRCWTINFVDEDNFHIDILPSVPMNDKDDGFIAITDRENPKYLEISNSWEVSNPKGYSAWFLENAKFQTYKFLESKRFYAQVEEIPDYKVRTPLQK